MSLTLVRLSLLKQWSQLSRKIWDLFALPSLYSSPPLPGIILSLSIPLPLLLIIGVRGITPGKCFKLRLLVSEFRSILDWQIDSFISQQSLSYFGKISPPLFFHESFASRLYCVDASVPTGTPWTYFKFTRFIPIPEQESVYFSLNCVAELWRSSTY